MTFNLSTYDPRRDILPPKAHISNFEGGDYSSLKGFYDSLRKGQGEVKEVSFMVEPFENRLRRITEKDPSLQELFELYYRNKQRAIKEIERSKNLFDGDLLGLENYHDGRIDVIPADWSDMLATNRSRDYLAEVYKHSVAGLLSDSGSVIANVVGVNVLTILDYGNDVYATIIAKRADTVDNPCTYNLLAGYLDNEFLNPKNARSMIEKAVNPLKATAGREAGEEFPPDHPLSQIFSIEAVVNSKTYLYGSNRKDNHPEILALYYVDRSNVRIQEDINLLAQRNNTEESKDIRIIMLPVLREHLKAGIIHLEDVVQPHRPLFGLAAYLADNTGEKLDGLGLKRVS